MDIPKLLDAISHLAWPVLATVVLWRIFPTIVSLVKSRGIKIKIGEMEVSVQEASEQLRLQIDDLQKKVAELRSAPMTSPAPPIAAPRSAPPAIPLNRPPRVLWTDDNPTNNALEIARLRDAGVEVSEANTTEEAARMLSGGARFDAVITDMGRRTKGGYRAQAGLELIRAVRSAGINTPIFVYTTAKVAESMRDEVVAAGGNGCTVSAVELFELLRQALGIAA
jgi:CheY-like chemotaxis protein